MGNLPKNDVILIIKFSNLDWYSVMSSPGCAVLRVFVGNRGVSGDY